MLFAVSLQGDRTYKVPTSKFLQVVTRVNKLLATFRVLISVASERGRHLNFLIFAARAKMSRCNWRHNFGLPCRCVMCAPTLRQVALRLFALKNLGAGRLNNLLLIARESAIKQAHFLPGVAAEDVALARGDVQTGERDSLRVV